MSLLLDTYVWIWSQESPERLGPRATRALLAPGNQNSVCAISTLEIARLVAVRTIELRVPLSAWIERSLTELGARSLPVTHEIAAEAFAFPAPFHKDPVDRILMAAARRHQSVAGHRRGAQPPLRRGPQHGRSPRIALAQNAWVSPSAGTFLPSRHHVPAAATARLRHARA